MKKGRELEARVIRVLRAIPGLTVHASVGGPDAGRDVIVEFGGAEVPMAVEVKHLVNPATAWQLVRRAGEHPDLPLLVVADDTTAAARDILVEHGVGVVDGTGNAHMDLPGLFVHVEQPRGAQRTVPAPPTRLSGRAGVAAQALLLDPLRHWRVGDLAATADVSAGLSHRVLSRLEREGVVISTGSGPRRVRRVENPAALLDLWAEENIDRPVRTTAYVLAQTTRQLVDRLGNDLGRAHIEYTVTGAAAGSILAPMVTAVPVVELWVTGARPPVDFLRAADADEVSKGHNVVFLQSKDDLPLAFRRDLGDLSVANRFRIYADLRRDPRRGREQAENLRREVIGF
ncbi:MAG: hypothetical protein ACJ73E_04300 [Mycobacteriales bacterium]